MGTTEQHFNLVRTSKSSWVAVHLSRSGPSADGNIYSRDSESTILRNSAPAPGRLFAQTATARGAFAERFPRLTIAMIALVLLAVTATAEIEWLHNAGFFWK